MSKPAKKPPARRNPDARELASGAYRQCVVKDKRRQERKPVKIETDQSIKKKSRLALTFASPPHAEAEATP